MNASLSHIRSLLARFYEGSATPDQVSELEAFFASASPASLPDDLLPDFALFASKEKCTIPADLESKAFAALDRTRQRRWKRILSRVAAAAALTAVLAAGTAVWLSRDTQSPAQPAPRSLQAAERIDTAAPAPLAPEAAPAAPEQIACAAPAKKVKKSLPKAPVGTVSAQNQPAGLAQTEAAMAQAKAAMEKACAMLALSRRLSCQALEQSKQNVNAAIEAPLERVRTVLAQPLPTVNIPS